MVGLVSQTPPGEHGIVPVQLLVFLQVHLVLVGCTETGCAWQRVDSQNPLCCLWTWWCTRAMYEKVGRIAVLQGERTDCHN